MLTNITLVAAGVGVSVVPASMRDIHREDVFYAEARDAPQLAAPLNLVSRASARRTRWRSASCASPCGLARAGQSACSVSPCVGRQTRRRFSATETAKSSTSAKIVRTRIPANTVLMSKEPSAMWMR